MNTLLDKISIKEFVAFAQAEQRRDSLTSEDPARFSARVDLLPTDSSYFVSEAVTNLYKVYLQCKYTYFSYLIDASTFQGDAIEFLNAISNLTTDYWTEEASTNEANVYLLRLYQFGKNTIKEWYSIELIEIANWMEHVTSGSFLKEHEDSEDIESHRFTISELDVVQKVQSIVSDKFVQLIEANKTNESEYLFAFLKALQLESGAEVCDFLYIDFEHNEVDFELASMSLTDEEIDSLIDNESYHEKIGITGSVLVDCDRKHLHVGTNNLPKDPRQAEKQNFDYTQIYHLKGGVKSFWVFPVRDLNGTIVAAFRVVNKNNGSIWTYSERFSLLAIAEWFSSFWDYTRRVLRNLDIDDVRKVTYKCCNDACYDCLGGLKKELLRKILEHLRSVAHRKVESHSIGASILIVPQNQIVKLDSPYAGFAKYPISFELKNMGVGESLDYLSLSYKGLNPKTSIFVYDDSLNFLGVYTLRASTDNFDNGVKELGKALPSAVLFTLIGGTYSIRIFKNAKMIADYYHSNAEGIWRFRCLKEIKERCSKTMFGKLMSENVFDNILLIALSLSFDRKGAIIVISDDENLDEKFKDGKRAIGNYNTHGIEFADNNYLIRDYATMDGAIVLSSNGTIREIGTILPVDDITRDNRYSTVYEQWEKWKLELSKKQKGSRHTTAIKFSMQNPTSCVLVVSENRGISIFYNGKALLWDDDISPI